MKAFSMSKFNSLSIGLAACVFLLSSCDNTNAPATTAVVAAVTASECDELSATGVITDANPIPCERLSKVSFSYVSDGGIIKDDGEWYVFDVIAPNAAAVADSLVSMGFYIAKAVSVANYLGDDQSSMADNNSSAFNGRPITGGTTWSMHAYGAAIDINPVQNPYIEIDEDGTAHIQPVASARYSVNRSEGRPYKELRLGLAEDVVDIFAREGFFIWGGDWNFPIDYQHFQFGPGSFVRRLAKLDYAQGRALIEQYTGMYQRCLTEQWDQGAQSDKVRKVCVERVVDAMP